MEIYKISEIFYSLQGEGALAGRPANFIRFYGCNLKCDFCDEPLHNEIYREMSVDDILNELENSPSIFVVLTGGEPSLYNLTDLIDVLKDKGYFVAVETNGYNFNNIYNADWITYSPKSPKIQYNGLIDEYKFVVDKMTDLTPIFDIIQTCREKNSDALIYIQPKADGSCVNKENIDFCVEIVKNIPDLKLSLQIHKMIGIA